jgi:outer membrane protein assembly factor BamB
MTTAEKPQPAEPKDAQPKTPGAQGPARAGVRWWPAAVIVALVVLGVAYIVWLSPLGPGWRFWVSVGVCFVGVLGLMGWVLLFSRLPWLWRVSGFLTPILVVVGFGYAYHLKLVRFDEFDGDSVPVWSSFTVGRSLRPAERIAEMAQPLAPANIRLVASEHDYPQFQGPQRDGIVRGIKLSRDWQAHPPREIARREIGAGWSGFAIVGGFAFTQELRGAVEVVACYSMPTLEPVWVFQDEEGYESSKPDGTGPRATPTVEAGRVYVMGGTGKVNCLDAATGRRVWQRHVLRDYGAAICNWGKSDSPLVLDDLVVVTGGGGQGPSLVAMNKETGKIAWTAAWSDDRPGTIGDAYASPALATMCGVPQILNQEDVGVAAYDPQTGRQLWRLDWPWGILKHPKVSQPMPLPGDRLFIAAEYGSGCALVQVKRDTQGEFSTELLWKSEALRTKFSNAVRHGDHLYGLHQGILRCIAWETGEVLWKKGRYGHGQVLLVDDLILVQAERPGDIALVEASPKGYREVGRVPALETTSWNTMALAGKYLLVRNDREAVCFELTPAE